MPLQVDALYQMDIARMGGNAEGGSDEDYKQFMAEIGMSTTPSVTGSAQANAETARHRQGLGYGGDRSVKPLTSALCKQ